MKGRVLIVAGSDSGGGAGIQADIKTVTALGGYAATAITALTAQNTEGVHGIEEVSPTFIRQQIEVVLTDIGADAIKTGMLHSAEVIETVARALADFGPDIPVIVDPVMVAKGGAKLLQDTAAEALKTQMIANAALITPNIPEAEVLTGLAIADLDAMKRAAAALHAMGPGAVLVKGGHLEGDTLYDLLSTPDGVDIFESTRIDTRHTHGTGCTLTSAIATGVAQELSLQGATARARDYVLEAIRTAPGYGAGHGPLNHGHTVRS